MMKYSTHYNSSDEYDGAVAALLIQNHFVFIRRSHTMPSHAGQIGFVGGHKKGHEQSPVETVMREFEEELGISAENLHVKGFSTIVNTTSKRKKIVPILCELNVGLDSFFKEVKSNGEWDYLLAIPVDDLKNEIGWTSGLILPHTQNSLVVHYFPVMHARYCVRRADETEVELLWGATAQMVRNILF